MAGSWSQGCASEAVGRGSCSGSGDRQQDLKRCVGIEAFEWENTKQACVTINLDRWNGQDERPSTCGLLVHSRQLLHQAP